MRRTKEEEFFPYTEKTTCFIEVSSGGTVRQVSCNKSEMEEACALAKEGRTALYAVWPGRYRSDLFIVDDIEALSDAYGIRRENQHKHDIEYSLSDLDDGISAYASVDIAFNCGCKLDLNNIKGIARDLKDQFGLEMTTTTGYGAHCSEGKTVYTVRMRRKSL